jgi:hypothetical protein
MIEALEGTFPEPSATAILIASAIEHLMQGTGIHATWEKVEMRRPSIQLLAHHQIVTNSLTNWPGTPLRQVNLRLDHLGWNVYKPWLCTQGSNLLLPLKNLIRGVFLILCAIHSTGSRLGVGVGFTYCL